MKNLKFWRQITVGNRYFCIQISENRPTYGDFGFHGVRSPTFPNFKTHKTFVLQRLLLYTNTYTLMVQIKFTFFLGTPPPPKSYPFAKRHLYL